MDGCVRWVFGLLVIGVCTDVVGDSPIGRGRDWVSPSGVAGGIPMGVFRPLDERRQDKNPRLIQGYRFRGVEKPWDSKDPDGSIGSSGSTGYAPNTLRQTGKNPQQTGEVFRFRNPRRKASKEPDKALETYQMPPSPPVWGHGGALLP